MPLTNHASVKNYKSLTFTGYPSCEDCLTWCEEGLAIAISENVHIIEHAAQPDQQPLTIAIRVDLFTHEEWPEKPLATIRHLSIGEEQSYSIAVALDWSPPGLGIHRRSVLTVLTSNLLLSIWETDGSPRNWRRTCVVNHHLPLAKSLDDSEIGDPRRCARIRSYAWSGPLRTTTSTAIKWGFQFLAVLDDQELVTIFQVSKSRSDQYGTWSLQFILTFSLPDSQTPEHNNNGTATELQRILTSRASVRRMKFLSWSDGSASSNSSILETQTTLVYQRYHQQVCHAVPLRFDFDIANSTSAAKHFKIEQVQSEPLASIPSSLQQETGIVYALDERPLWREPLKALVADFDKINRLDGIYRIRFWGSASSPQNDVEAACVSLHPRDMHEYTSNVLEKCRIVFRSLQNSITPLNQKHLTLEEVLVNVLSFVIPHLNSTTDCSTLMDTKLLRVLHAWVTVNDINGDYKLKIEGALRQTNVSDGPIPDDETGTSENEQTSLQKSIEKSRSPEVCDFCNAPISLNTKNSSSICANGHAFSRCNLSLLSIQEPGISKYCSQCKRQFLNLSKLKPPPGPCLITKLFHEFDVCPYCQERFRR